MQKNIRCLVLQVIIIWPAVNFWFLRYRNNLFPNTQSMYSTLRPKYERFSEENNTFLSTPRRRSHVSRNTYQGVEYGIAVELEKIRSNDQSSSSDYQLHEDPKSFCIHRKRYNTFPHNSFTKRAWRRVAPWMNGFAWIDQGEFYRLKAPSKMNI